MRKPAHADAGAPPHPVIPSKNPTVVVLWPIRPAGPRAPVLSETGTTYPSKRKISANSGNSYNEQYTGSFSAGTSGLSLRGIGQKNTLILVNGKRVASYATAQNLQGTFVDLNSLPMAAVQRIEVLKDGASSVYGSDPRRIRAGALLRSS